MYTEYIYKDSLSHHGIKGQKWGVRRYQNPDGTLTPEGKARYAPRSVDSSITKKLKRDLADLTEDQWRAKYHNRKKDYMKAVDKYGDPYMNSTAAKIGKKLDASNTKNRNLDKIRKAYERGEISRNEYKKSKDQITENYKLRKKAINEGKPDALSDKYARDELRLLQDNPKGRGKSRKEIQNKKAAKEEYRKEKARLIAQWKKDASKYYTDDEKYEAAADKLTKDLDAARMKYDKAIGKKVTQSHYWNKLDDYSSSIVSKQKMPQPAGALINGPNDDYYKRMNDFNRRHGAIY